MKLYLYLIAIALVVACNSKSGSSESTIDSTQNTTTFPKDLSPDESWVKLVSIDMVEAQMIMAFKDETGDVIYLSDWDMDIEKEIIEPYFNSTITEGMPFPRYELKSEFADASFALKTEMRKIKMLVDETEEEVEVRILIGFRALKE
jgi:hypothetical protein